VPPASVPRFLLTTILLTRPIQGRVNLAALTILGGVRGIGGLGREGQDTGASQLSCYSSSNEGVETRALICLG
jgi:hypothetical protein